MRTRSDRGFTLIEVLVALAIASGALVLILSANAASLRRSAGAGVDERLGRATESKLSEWLSGAERHAEGPLSAFDGHRWEVRSVLEPAAPLRQLRRVTFTVVGPGGMKSLEWVRLVHAGEGPR